MTTKQQKVYLDLLGRRPTTLTDTAALIDCELDLGMRTPEVARLRDFVPEEQITDHILYEHGREMSVFRGAHSAAVLSGSTLEHVYEGVSASPILKRHIDTIAGLPDKKAVDRYKQHKLPAISPSAMFDGARGAGRSFRHTGLVVIDIDGIYTASHYRDIIIGSPQVALAFVSPSGKGLKAIIAIEPIPTTPIQHEAAYRYVASAVGRLLKLKVDISKDVARLCFMAYDPDVHYNPEPEPMRWQWGFEYEKKAYKPAVPESAADVVRKAVHALSFIKGDVEYRDMIRIVGALQNDIGDAVRDAAINWMVSVRGHRHWSHAQASKEWERVTSTPLASVHLGSLYHYAKQHGWRRERKGLPDRF